MGCTGAVQVNAQIFPQFKRVENFMQHRAVGLTKQNGVVYHLDSDVAAEILHKQTHGILFAFHGIDLLRAVEQMAQHIARVGIGKHRIGSGRCGYHAGYAVRRATAHDGCHFGVSQTPHHGVWQAVPGVPPAAPATAHKRHLHRPR
jgi:hypothetical protein